MMKKVFQKIENYKLEKIKCKYLPANFFKKPHEKNLKFESKSQTKISRNEFDQFEGNFP